MAKEEEIAMRTFNNKAKFVREYVENMYATMTGSYPGNTSLLIVEFTIAALDVWEKKQRERSTEGIW
jgi:hypothetical protein